jgi:hypothetical protein
MPLLVPYEVPDARAVYACTKHEDCREHPEVGVACWQRERPGFRPELGLSESLVLSMLRRIYAYYEFHGDRPEVLPVTMQELVALRRSVDTSVLHFLTGGQVQSSREINIIGVRLYAVPGFA